MCRFPLRRWTVASVFRCVHGQLRRCSEALADRSVGGRLSMDSCVCVSFSLRVTLCSSTCVVLCVRRTSALRFLFGSFVFFSLLRCVAPALFSSCLSFALALSLFASPFAVFLLFCVSLRGWIVIFIFFLAPTGTGAPRPAPLSPCLGASSSAAGPSMVWWWIRRRGWGGPPLAALHRLTRCARLAHCTHPRGGWGGGVAVWGGEGARGR